MFTDCLILLIHFKFKYKHKMFLKREYEARRIFPSCDHNKRHKKRNLLHKAHSLCASSDFKVLESSVEVTALWENRTLVVTNIPKTGKKNNF